jgi:tRNA C32,U32 (ribose-2'-O)-methylase TrmJ
MRFNLTFESHTNLTPTCKTYIKNNLNPTFGNDDEEVYSLSYTLEMLEEEIALNFGNEIFGITNNDIDLLKKLSDENVDYITLYNKL